jgi:DOMON domain
MIPTSRTRQERKHFSLDPIHWSRSLAAILVIVALLLSGCGSGGSPESLPAATATEQPAAAIDGLAMTDEYERSQTISTVEVSWTIDGDNLRMALSAPCTGYISVGFDPENRKEGGNYIIGYVADGEAVVRDHVGTRGNLHDADTDLGGTDNILAFAGTEIDGQTTLEFIIPLDSGDDFDRPLVPGNKHVILVAFQNTRDDLISIHSRHGVAQVDL